MNEGTWKPRSPWLALNASGVDAEGDFSITVALHVNERQEAIFIERTNGLAKIYDVKGNGIGWQNKQGVHLHPSAEGKLPPKVEIDYSFEDNQGASIQALKTPAPIPHEQER